MKRAAKHRTNPALVIYGNPPDDATLIGSDVQGVIYRHADGSFRVHGFGNTPLRLENIGNALTITGLRQRTWVRVYGLADGRMLITGDD